ncbi:MAG: pitrilysin family protein [Mucinivorans sp.]
MIEFSKKKLSNGLTVIAHTDMATPMASVNVLYKVGARNENPRMTGLAHLVEHLMFGGSANVEDFDTPLQMAGGENNAFTNNDYTNYYITLPAGNLATALWVESDRMRDLKLTTQGLEIQRKVVKQEYAERYENEPYGDLWSILRPLCYGAGHPYSWPTIGRRKSHIDAITMEAVSKFYDQFYQPRNAVLSIAAPLATDEIMASVEQWFAPIKNTILQPLPPVFPPMAKCSSLEVERDVPSSVIYICFGTEGRLSAQVTALDVVSDILSEGVSGRLVQRLVKQRPLFSSVNAYISGDEGPGLFVVTGKVMGGVSVEQAEQALWSELREISTTLVSQYEIEKVRNKALSNEMFTSINSMNKAMNLAYYEFLGSASLINDQIARHHGVSCEELCAVSSLLFVPENAYTLYYLSSCVGSRV